MSEVLLLERLARLIPRPGRSRRIAARLAVLSCMSLLLAGLPAQAPAQNQKPPARPAACVKPGEWRVPAGRSLTSAEVMTMAAKAPVVLLGETHDAADDHRWQLQVASALAAQGRRTVIGFESFPRRVQGVLDRWVAGELNEQEFLQASDWRRVWNFDPQLYLPLFHFARLNRIPMLALNVEMDLVRQVGREGFDKVPAERREGVDKAAPAQEAYLDRLYSVYAAHPDKARVLTRSDAEFIRFVEAQQVWDRAMAQAIAAALARDPDAQVIGIMGSGHVTYGHGVEHQLQALGVKGTVSLLPWEADAGCSRLQPGLATAVFGLPAAKQPAPRPRLGISIALAETDGRVDGIRVVDMQAGSLADSTGLRSNDVIVEAAGATLKSMAELQGIVAGMAPGTWLPLKVRRGESLLELVAKFPTAAR